MGKLRKGQERKLQAAVRSGEARVREMEGKVKALDEAREEVNKRAELALQKIDSLFREVAQHKHELEEGMKAVRKLACQPITDMANVCRALQRVVHNAEGHGGGGMGGNEGEDHVGCVLAAGGRRGRGGQGCWKGGRWRVLLLEFVVPGGGDAVHGALDVWKTACRLCIEVDGGEWEARPGVVSQPLPSLNTVRNYLGAVAMPSNHVIVLGGHGDDDNVPFFHSVERLEQGGSAWEVTGLVLPTSRQGGGTCAVGTTVVVVGGFNGEYLDVVEAVDTVGGASTTLPPLPQAVSACGAVSVQGRVIVTGGDDGEEAVSAAWVLDVGSIVDFQQHHHHHQWASLPSMAQPRSYHGAAAGGGCVFVCGGIHDRDSLDSCEVLRVAMGEGQRGWEALPSMPKAIAEPGCCYGGGNVFVAGGWAETHHSLLAFSVRERTWAQVATLVTGREGCAVVCVGRRVMVLGGINEESTALLDSCEMFEF